LSTAKLESPEATFSFSEGGTLYAHTTGLTDSENYGAAKKKKKKTQIHILPAFPTSPKCIVPKFVIQIQNAEATIKNADF